MISPNPGAAKQTGLSGTHGNPSHVPYTSAGGEGGCAVGATKASLQQQRTLLQQDDPSMASYVSHVVLVRGWLHHTPEPGLWSFEWNAAVICHVNPKVHTKG